MSQVGRISGPLLTANLERNGIDLAFRNTSGTTQLLYFDVTNGRIGVNKSAPQYQLDVNGNIKTTNVISDTADIDLLQFSTNNINNLTGDINIQAPDIIKISTLATDNIKVNDNIISSYRSNSDIEITPNGSGKTDIQSDLEVYGNLHSTGNITLDGNITIGDNINQDTITFDADIDSSIFPDGNNTRDLGSSTKRWLLMEAQSINNEIFNTNSVNANGAILVKRTGNMFYVAENGDDTNVGDHPQGPFKTIKHALSASDASSGQPVTIYVFPGGYEEELPLVVPPNVSIIGEDMRNCFIRPTSADQSKDIFHLNGETSIQNLTIKDFYYDSGNNTGHAFRFAPNTVVSTRSPYVQNVTVITQGTTTSVSDPRGFASGDAGKGALVDGASVNSASNEASMLFHSVTFITPGVDAITMTNGVRVEWLNSFSYFANRGLYAVRGSTGHLSSDGSTTQFGAELRSIGSANVYGNFGAVADGADTIMYLIQHNFAYNGSGKFVDNDNSRVIQSQEVTELNSGKIYYQSIDQLGNFRIGDDFFIDQEAGTTTLSLSEASVDSLSGLNITTNNQTTVVNGDFVETGNLRIDNNKLLSTIGNVVVSAANNTVNLLTNTNITKDLSIVGDLSFDGNLNLIGNQTTDILNLNVNFDQDVNPHITGVHSLGTQSKEWLDLNTNKGYIGDVLFYNNYVSTFESNADLELRASGTGQVDISNNNLEITNSLQVNGTTNLQDLNTNSFVLSNNLNISTNFSTTNLTVENITVGSQAQFEEINIDGNVIATTSTNANLELRANGTGNILLPTQDLIVSNNLDVQGTWNTSDMNVTQQVSASQFDNNTININSNIITTDISNADLELRATKDVKLNDSVSITNELTVANTTTLNNTAINGNITHTGTATQTGNRVIAGDLTVTGDLDLDKSLQFEEILFDDNFITTTSTNANLELRANGTGQITVPYDNVNITNNLTLGTLNASTINIDNEFELENMISSTDIEIFDNVITTTNTNSNLELRSAGTGTTTLENIGFNNNIISSTSNSISFSTNQNLDLNIDTALLIPVGTTAERVTSASGGIDGGTSLLAGSVLDGGDATTVFDITDVIYDGGQAIITSTGQQGDLRFNSDDNVFEGTATNTVTFGGVFSSNRLTSVTSDPTSDNLRFIVSGAVNPLDSTSLVGEISGNTLSIHGIQTDDINVDTNIISTNVTNSNLELQANGSGSIVVDNIEVSSNNITNTSVDAVFKFASTGIGYPKFDSTGAIRVPAGTTAERPSSPVLGQTRHNTDDDILETWTGSAWQNSAGEFDAVSEAEMDDIALIQTLIYG